MAWGSAGGAPACRGREACDESGLRAGSDSSDYGALRVRSFGACRVDVDAGLWAGGFVP